MSEGVPGTPAPPDSPNPPEPRERLGLPKKQVVVFNIGGTALDQMVEGRLMGKGILDDKELAKMELSAKPNTSLEPSDIQQGERELVNLVYERMRGAINTSVDAGEALAWASYRAYGEEKRFGDFVEGPLMTLFSGQSSHFRPSLNAPIVTILIDQAIREQNKPILGIIGTDFGPDAVLPIIDALVFDTHLPFFIFSGTLEPKDPQNIINMAVAARINISQKTRVFRGRSWSESASGALWVFDEEIFSPASLIKSDPSVGFKASTFISPRAMSSSILRDVKYVSEEAGLRFTSTGEVADWEQETSLPPENHITRRLSMPELYDAINDVGVVDLGDQNPVWEQVKRILDPETPAVVVAAHGLGNANNVIKTACAETVRRGKLVITVSRAEAGEVDSQDVQSLTDINTKELEGTGAKILNGGRLNKTIAKALLVRARLEGRDQAGTQALIDDYSIARGFTL